MKAIKRGVVSCSLPKAGLGNQLFPLMKAYVFARLNNLPLIVTGYNRLSIGPYIRREKSKRAYFGYFLFEKSLPGQMFDKWRVRNLTKKLRIVDEPLLQKTEVTDGILFTFTARIRWDDFFEGLKEHRHLVKEVFWSLVRPRVKKQLARLSPPVIGVHIRLGDFRKLRATENFRSVGGVRTPEEYFIDVINSIRNMHGSQLPVSIFTDGYRHELPGLFKLPNISLVEGNSDIVDMLLLSKSKIIVASAGSTFSYWAGFLSEAPLIMHPDHIHQPIRHNDHDEEMFEGAFDPQSAILLKDISGIATV